MHYKIFLQQLRRGGRRTALYILLLASVTAFFVMSINLYRNSVTNLAAVEDAYSTIAVMELYGDVNLFGELAEPTDDRYIGHRSVEVKGYDFSGAVSADGVIGWDLRTKYGAYIEGETALHHKSFPMGDADVIHFKLTGDEPVELPIAWDATGASSFFGEETIPLELEVLDSAAGCYQYSGKFEAGSITAYREREAQSAQVQRLNRSDEADKVILYPGVEYVASISSTSGWAPTEKPGVYKFVDDHTWDENGLDPLLLPEAPAPFRPENLMYGAENLRLAYGRYSEFLTWIDGSEVGQPFPIQRWEDVQSDPEMKAYFEGAWEAVKIQASVFNVTLTDDISGVPLYHLGGAYIREGRAITREEYESGAKVCLVSEEQAGYQGWQVGDTLDMSFFIFDGIPNVGGDDWAEQSVWHKGTEGFFYDDTYEIVGIYAQTPTMGNSGIAKSTLAMAWNTIYIPHNAVENTRPLEEQPVHGALLTIWLENGSIDRFLADVEAKGLLEEKAGQYNPSFSFFDQGYSLVQPGLEAMNGTARLLLVLSAVLLAVTCVLLAYFFAQNHRQSVGIFRMLGGSKVESLGAVVVCALLVAAAGAALGGLAGYGLARSVGERILDANLTESASAGGFQAFVLDASVAEKQTMVVQADPGVTAMAAVAALLVTVLLVLGFVLLYIRKEPRELLPKDND